jgi:hypothetical protein
VLEDIIGRRRL